MEPLEIAFSVLFRLKPTKIRRHTIIRQSFMPFNIFVIELKNHYMRSVLEKCYNASLYFQRHFSMQQEELLLDLLPLL